MNNIKLEFLPYEQALELKELGFDEPCFALWFTENKQLIQEIFNDTRSFDTDLFISAPTFSQALRWFRDNLGLYSAVNVDQTMEPKFAYCISRYYSDDSTAGWNQIVFNSDLHYVYEEAELECIKNLIEIANEQP